MKIRPKNAVEIERLVVRRMEVGEDRVKKERAKNGVEKKRSIFEACIAKAKKRLSNHTGRNGTKPVLDEEPVDEEYVEVPTVDPVL